MNVIDKIIVKYLVSTSGSNKVFFASLLTLMQKREDNSISTAGVTVIDGQLYLLYNKQFIDSILERYGVDKVKGVLEHELLHIVYDHIGKAKKYNRIHKVYNIAADMAINQMIDTSLLPDALPVVTQNGIRWDVPCPVCKGKKEIKGKKCPNCKGRGIINGKLVSPEDYNMPPDKDAEFYYNKLIKESRGKSGQGHSKCPSCGGTGKRKGKNGKEEKCQNCGGTGEGKGDTLDNHERWSKGTESEQMVKEVIKKAVREAYQNSKKLTRGYLPEHLEQAIQDLLKPPTVNWKQLLKQYIGSSIKTGFKSSWKRPPRRVPICDAQPTDSFFNYQDMYKGKTANRTIKMMVAIDTSGSVSKKDFEDFIIEMKGILNVYKCRIDIIHCDATIQKTEQLRPYTKISIDFKGRGGTSFLPVFKEYEQRPDYDLLIYFTDMYGDESKCRSNKSVIWVTTERYNESTKPACGRIVHIKHTDQVEN